MKVSILINTNAGKMNSELIVQKIQDTLFRCETSICISSTLNKMEEFILQELQTGTDYFILCGGDGTINRTLQLLMQNRETAKIPPMVIVSLGTANDLATEMGLAKKVESAVRNIFEGVEKSIDVIEISSENQRAYMLTNGGIGIPARSAEIANLLRSRLKAESQNKGNPLALKLLAGGCYKLSKALGDKIYSLSLLEGVRSWKESHREYEIEVPGKMKVDTDASIILVNNQKCLGAKYTPAPYTNNSDGRMNVLWNVGADIMSVTKAVLDIRTGDVSNSKELKSIEIEEFTIRTKDRKSNLDFFGDGEILVKGAEYLNIKCIKSALSIMVKS